MDTVEDAVTMAPTTWLGRWVDPELVLPRDLTAVQLEAEEIERLLRDLSIVLFASSLPRRLGGDAMDDELASDKKRCRRVAWSLRQSLLQWTKKIELPDQISDEIRQMGASLEWPRFGDDHQAILTERTKRAATWAALNGEKKWGMGIVTRFENERKWINYALR